MKASDFIADTLEQKGVSVVFEMIGGMITHIIDSLHQRTKIKIVSLHHEQSAGFAAEAVGRIADAPGVALPGSIRRRGTLGGGREQLSDRELSESAGGVLPR